jgi:hypothetical protein
MRVLEYLLDTFSTLFQSRTNRLVGFAMYATLSKPWADINNYLIVGNHHTSKSPSQNTTIHVLYVLMGRGGSSMSILMDRLRKRSGRPPTRHKQVL